LNGLDWMDVLVKSLGVSNRSIWTIEYVKWNEDDQLNPPNSRTDKNCKVRRAGFCFFWGGVGLEFLREVGGKWEVLDGV
jgi:hypothetical protein